jgi:hypothetical protein
MERADRSPPPPEGEPPPLGQRLYDNMFLLLVLGVVIMLAVYTGWGLVELILMPPATLP